MALGRDALQALVSPIAQAFDCELWGVEFFAQGQRSVLRIYIDKPGGVGIGDCQSVSGQLSSVLDVEDPIGGEYTLEVSSPGLERPLYSLAQYKLFVGEHVDVHLRIPFDGRKKFKGLLKGVEADEVILNVDNAEYVFPFESIEKAKVAPQYS